MGWRRLGVVALVLFGEGMLRGDAIPEAMVEEIPTLIRQLGEDRFARREAASRALVAIGEPALPALRVTLVESDDAEVRRRARLLLTEIMLDVCQSPSTGMPLALIEPGEFAMGSDADESGRRDDELRHHVWITQPFLLGVHEVTQEEYEQLMGVNPSWFTHKGGGSDKLDAEIDTSRFPVEQVSWFDAIAFCNELSQQDGYEPYYDIAHIQREGDSIDRAQVKIIGGTGYRLPTEAEWEYACRAWTTTWFHFGNNCTGAEANAKAYTSGGGYGARPKLVHLGRTTHVGSYPPNTFGLFDMHGNAGEWCWDWYDKGYYAESPLYNPTGPDDGIHRVIRGGSWLVGDGSCRSASRFWHTPAERKDYTGFRVARTP